MSDINHRYFIVNKPYNMVSQFVSSHDVVLLGDLDFSFPEGSHAVGRLDNHSEGLLIVTTDKSVTRRLFQGEVPHKRTYLVQVKNIITDHALEQLRTGISIQIKGGGFYTTQACDVKLANPHEPWMITNNLSKYQESSWVEITLTEGKFHQVRKMVRTVGHKCRRLIRTSIEDISVGNMAPGTVVELKRNDFFKLLKIRL